MVTDTLIFRCIRYIRLRHIVYCIKNLRQLDIFYYIILSNYMKNTIRTIQYNTIEYNTTQHNTIQYNAAIRYNAIQDNTYWHILVHTSTYWCVEYACMHKHEHTNEHPWKSPYSTWHTNRPTNLLTLHTLHTMHTVKSIRRHIYSTLHTCMI